MIVKVHLASFGYHLSQNYDTLVGDCRCFALNFTESSPSLYSCCWNLANKCVANSKTEWGNWTLDAVKCENRYYSRNFTLMLIDSALKRKHRCSHAEGLTSLIDVKRNIPWIPHSSPLNKVCFHFHYYAELDVIHSHCRLWCFVPLPSEYSIGKMPAQSQMQRSWASLILNSYWF